MKLEDVMSTQWIDSDSLKSSYISASPYPHIVMDNFIKPDLLKSVANEFPDLAKTKNAVRKFKNNQEIKLASKGMENLSPTALFLNSYLQSDLMLNWLNKLTGIEEPLISDPYLSGGGYHEIKRGGMLKVHADFNKHPSLDLDRRINMLIYLNEDWQEEWGGDLQLFDENMNNAVQRVYPRFNTAVIFTTTSFTFHGHPDPLNCPKQRSRRSLAYYYFSTGRPESEISAEQHSTIFRERSGEVFDQPGVIKSIKNIFK